MEDKIVGPLTLVQFMELVFRLFGFFTFCFRYGGLIVTIVVGGPVLLFGLALAFLKIQDNRFPTSLWRCFNTFCGQSTACEKRSVRRKNWPSPPKLARFTTPKKKRRP